MGTYRIEVLPWQNQDGSYSFGTGKHQLALLRQRADLNWAVVSRWAFSPKWMEMLLDLGAEMAAKGHMVYGPDGVAIGPKDLGSKEKCPAERGLHQGTKQKPHL